MYDYTISLCSLLQRGIMKPELLEGAVMKNKFDEKLRIILLNMLSSGSPFICQYIDEIKKLFYDKTDSILQGCRECANYHVKIGESKL